VKELDGIVTPSNERKRVQFTSFDPPTNVFSSVTFLDAADEVIGRAPVSLVLLLRD
jgi:hypothetical protein